MHNSVMDFKLPQVPDDFDDDLRDGSMAELAKTEQDNFLMLYEEVLSDLMRYYTVGFLAEEEYRTVSSGSETEMPGIADSHPLAEAGLRLQDQCQAIYDSLRGVEAAASNSENADPMSFYQMIIDGRGDYRAADDQLVQAHNQLLDSWTSFIGIAGELAQQWLSEADSRIDQLT